MAGFNIKVSKVQGVQQLEKKLKTLNENGIFFQADAVKKAVLIVHGNAVKLIQTRSPGKKQIRYSPRREITAANPGEAPNTDTGRLVQSIKFDIEDNGLKGFVGTNLKYGAYLEFGTQDMDPRPWLSTALKMAEKLITELFKAAVKKAVKATI